MIEFSVETDIALRRPTCSPTSPTRASSRPGRRTPSPHRQRTIVQSASGPGCARFTAPLEANGATRIAQPILRHTLKRQFTGYCMTLKSVLENPVPAV